MMNLMCTGVHSYAGLIDHSGIVQMAHSEIRMLPEQLLTSIHAWQTQL